jgi:hypothetical protein
MIMRAQIVVEVFGQEITVPFALPEAARTWDERRLQNYLSGEAEQVRDKMNVYGEVVEE